MENAIGPMLETVAEELHLYLDRKGDRVARGAKRKVVWADGKGNAHDLDYVFEAGGTQKDIGVPRAFIEIAWRRYTKHSRNKAQEIQGAILPLAERYCKHHPFLGVILGGVFTEGSLTQLRSHGFTVLYFPYDSVMRAFAESGIDAEFDEDTPDRELLRKVRAYERLGKRQRERIARRLRENHAAELRAFVASLRTALTRQISSIYILSLHGVMHTLTDLAAAIAYIQAFDESKSSPSFVRYEVGVKYTNGDEIRGQFADKAEAISFLRRFE